MTRRVFRGVRDALARLMPQDCFLCGAASGDAALCDACAAELPRQAIACPRCAMPSPGGAVCGRCLAEPPAFDATLAAFRYEFPVDRIVQSLKYQGRLFLAPWLARAIAARLDPGDLPDLLVPMPLHRSRLAERGYNQAVEIARVLHRETGVPLALDAAQRTRATEHQVDLPLAARATNVRGAFSCSAAVLGRRVAVVDDVMTSGATLEELARTLKRAGAVRVVNWIGARTVTHA